MPVTSGRAARRALALLLLAAAGCSREVTSPTSVSLPPELGVRSLSPYIEGRIVERRDGVELRIHVRALRGDAPVREAIVTVPPTARLLWSDGTVAQPSDLRVGRAIALWTTGVELRSHPPQVTAEAMALQR